jgi:hypothetical protein
MASEVKSMTAMFGLYYPHVRFRDERWLKTTALYWERMYRLFPDDENYQTLPTVSTVEREFTDAGFVSAVHPSVNARQNAARQFATVLGSLDLSQYRLDDRRPTEFEDTFAGFAAPVGWENLLDYVADWKLVADLFIELTEQRLAVQNGPRLWMHSALARAYLLVLGMKLAEDYGASPVSDEEVHHSAGGQDVRALVATCLADGNAVSFTEPGQYDTILINLAVATVLPHSLDEVQPEQIIRFREKYAGERVRFRQKVEELLREAGELDRIRDQNVLIDHLQVCYDVELKPALADLQKALRGAGVETMLSAMDVQVAVPAAAATGLAALVVHPAAPVAAAFGGAGFALGLWKTAIRQRRERSTTLTQSPVAYLHHLQTDLAPVPLVERVRSALARIIPAQH